jgi:hypothetical protein
VAPSPLALKVVELLLGDALQPPEVRPQASAFPALVGQNYHEPSTGSVMGFSDVSDRLCMSWQAGDARPMHQGEGKLWLGLQDLPLNDLVLDAADIDPQRAPDTLVLHEGGQPRRFERIAAAAPELATLAEQLCGDYTSPDLDATAQVALAGGRLLLTVHGSHGQHVCALTPLSADVMTLVSTDPVLGQMGKSVLTVARKEGRVTGLRLSTLRTRNIQLARQEPRA